MGQVHPQSLRPRNNTNSVYFHPLCTSWCRSHRGWGQVVTGQSGTNSTENQFLLRNPKNARLWRLAGVLLLSRRPGGIGDPRTKLQEAKALLRRRRPASCTIQQKNNRPLAPVSSQGGTKRPVRQACKFLHLDAVLTS